MAEYIDKQAFIKHLQKDPLFNLVEQYGITHVIESFPAADVQPVRHGRWERRECGPTEYECKCSECWYRDFMIPWHDTYWFHRNYCPNCGAKMDGGAESDNEKRNND